MDRNVPPLPNYYVDFKLRKVDSEMLSNVPNVTRLVNGFGEPRFESCPYDFKVHISNHYAFLPVTCIPLFNQLYTIISGSSRHDENILH